MGLQRVLISLPAIILAIGIHEASHAFAAYSLGDNTAKNLGRLSLNPVKHIDPIGFLMLLLVGFGWAKPVPINPNNFKDYKKGTVLTALAGPVSNIVIAIIASFIYWTSIGMYVEYTKMGFVFAQMMIMIIIINVNLAVFNLLPIPPLDGAKVAGILLPTKWYRNMLNYENMVQLIIALLLFSGLLGGILSPITQSLLNLILTITKIIVGFIFGIMGI